MKLQLHLTGIPLFDNLIDLFLSGLLCYVLFFGLKNMAQQHARHNYPGMIVSLIGFLILLGIIWMPDKMVAFGQAIMNMFSTNVPTS